MRRSAGEQSILGQQLVFALKMRKLEKFSGKPGHGVSVYEFIEDMTRILKTRPTSQEEQVDLLEGPAKEEMRFRPIEEKRSLKVEISHILPSDGSSKAKLKNFIEQYGMEQRQ